jgi:hypothetical protein
MKLLPPLALAAAACGTGPTAATPAKTTTVVEGTFEGKNDSRLYSYRPVARGILVATLNWTFIPLPSETARPPALALRFSGEAGPSETPPLVSSRAVDPAGLDLFASPTLEVLRRGDCGCRVEYKLTLTGPPITIGPFL